MNMLIDIGNSKTYSFLSYTNSYTDRDRISIHNLKTNVFKLIQYRRSYSMSNVYSYFIYVLCNIAMSNTITYSYIEERTRSMKQVVKDLLYQYRALGKHTNGEGRRIRRRLRRLKYYLSKH